MRSFLLLLLLLFVCVVATVAVDAQPAVTTQDDQTFLNDDNATTPMELPQSDDMLEKLSEQLGDLQEMVTTLQTETTNLPQDLQTSTQRLVDGLQKEMIQQLQSEFQGVDNLVQELMQGIQGLPPRLSSEAADLVVEIEETARSLVTIATIVISLLLLLSLCCGCGCGAGLIYMTTRRCEKIMAQYHTHAFCHAPPLVASRHENMEAFYDSDTFVGEDNFEDEDLPFRNDDAVYEYDC